MSFRPCSHVVAKWRCHLRAILVRGACLALALAAAPVLAGQNGALVESVSEFLIAANAGLDADVRVSVNATEAGAPDCVNPEPFWPGAAVRTTGEVTVGVRCDGADTRYIRSQVRVFGAYFTATRPLHAGDVVAASDIVRRTGDITFEIRRLPQDEQAIVGQQARRSIGAGQTIFASMLKAPDLVSYGDHVTIVLSAQGFSVSTEGTALGSAGAGQTVRVRTAAGKILLAKPRSPGVVDLLP